jgi:hypothetical protein
MYLFNGEMVIAKINFDCVFNGLKFFSAINVNIILQNQKRGTKIKSSTRSYFKKYFPKFGE